MATQNPVQAALKHLEQQRAALAEQEAEKVTAEAELASMQERAGEEVLDDPAAGARLPKLMQTLRDRIEISTSAAVAAKTRVAAAEAAYLSAEADVLEQAAEKCRRRLAAHQARTDELLAQLEEHEAKFVPEHLLIAEQRHGGFRDAPTTWINPKSAALHDDVTVAETRVFILRELAAGRDPSTELQRRASFRDGTIARVPIPELYSTCVWGPDAVVPAPEYLRRGGTRQMVEELAAVAEPSDEAKQRTRR